MKLWLWCQIKARGSSESVGFNTWKSLIFVPNFMLKNNLEFIRVIFAARVFALLPVLHYAIRRRQCCVTLSGRLEFQSVVFSSYQSHENKWKIREGCLDSSIMLEVNKYFVCVSAEWESSVCCQLSIAVTDLELDYNYHLTLKVIYPRDSCWVATFS